MLNETDFCLQKVRNVQGKKGRKTSSRGIFRYAKKRDARSRARSLSLPWSLRDWAASRPPFQATTCRTPQIEVKQRTSLLVIFAL